MWQKINHKSLTLWSFRFNFEIARQVDKHIEILIGHTIYSTTSSRVIHCDIGCECEAFVYTHSSPPCPTAYQTFDNLCHFLSKCRVHCKHQEVRAVVKRKFLQICPASMVGTHDNTNIDVMATKSTRCANNVFHNLTSLSGQGWSVLIGCSQQEEPVS